MGENAETLQYVPGSALSANVKALFTLQGKYKCSD